MTTASETRYYNPASFTWESFYPTPLPLLDKMFANINWLHVQSVLEPSAGRGDIAEYLKKLRYKYWNKLFYSKEFAAKYTSKLLEQVYNSIRDMSEFEFSEFNIRQIQIDMTNQIVSSMERSIIELFNRMSVKHSWYDEMSKNIHYYDGWKTNKSYIINSKVILPINFAEYIFEWVTSPYNHAVTELCDIEKTLQYLDGVQSNSSNLMAILEQARSDKQTKNIHCKYFDFTCYKKGTTHITFTNLDILKKFNLFGSQHKGWLPPVYGKMHYDEMDDDEQLVVDAFMIII